MPEANNLYLIMKILLSKIMILPKNKNGSLLWKAQSLAKNLNKSPKSITESSIKEEELISVVKKS
jgi:hypothetical protein